MTSAHTNIHELVNKLKARNLLIILALFFISFGLRIWYLSTNLFFGPEQGEAFLVLHDIVYNHKFTLIGAKTDITGIFHGPVYYYVAAIPFLLSHGDPLFVAYFLIAFNCCSIFFIYLIGKNLFSARVGLIAAVLFTISFLTVIYPRWLGTNPLGIPFSSLFVLLFIYFLKGKRWVLFPTAVAFGLLTQSEFLNLLFFSAIVFIWLIVYFKEFRKQHILGLLLGFIIAVIFSVGPFILFDLRHNFLITKNLILVLKGGSGFHITYLKTFTRCYKIISSFLGNLLFLYNSLVGFIIALLSLLIYIYGNARKERIRWIIPIWILTIPFLLIVLGQNILFQYFVTIIPAILLTVAYTIDVIWQRISVLGILVLLVYVVSSLYSVGTNLPENNNVFFQSTQPELKYSDELAVIKRIYSYADNRPFTMQSFTVPYWSQEGWQYLFWYYGLSHYGYLPIAQKAKTLFVIVQANPSDPVFENNWLRITVSTWGTEVHTFSYGILTVMVLKVPGGIY